MFVINWIFRKLTKTLIFITIFVLLLVVFLEWYCRLDPPTAAADDKTFLQLQRKDHSPTFRTIGNNWIRKNKHGLWEIYVQGGSFERGVIMGKLAQELVVAQEEYFVAQIREIVPSENYLHFLRYFIGVFNRDLDYYVPIEYQKEIYGISHAASKDFDFIGTNYERILNYHAAHDVGHALKDLAMVGCTSFSAWDSASADSSLIVGRNFDFYVGDDFAKDKMVAFVVPDTGYRFMYITWGGMIGVTSGMNEQGLTVTINAAKSDLPTGARVPIAIVARDILQHAKNIDEAYAIAQKHPTFVSESIMVASANDGYTAIIEKGINKIALFKPQNKDYIICTNHYQSDTFARDSNNVQNMRESSSVYRYQRTEELIKQQGKLNYYNTAAILRDYKGKGDTNIGLGNEKAVNQLIAHHSIVFMPEKRLVWVSTAPYQLGTYVCYNLNEVFTKHVGLQQDREINDSSRTIVADTLLQNPIYEGYTVYRSLKPKVEKAIKAICDGKKPPADTEAWIQQLPLTNPHYYHVHQLVGDYWYARQDFKKAKQAYLTALSKEIPSVPEKQYIQNQIRAIP